MNRRRFAVPIRRTRAAAVALGLMVCITLLPVGPLAAQDAPPDDAPPGTALDPEGDARTYEALARCVGRTGQLLVVMLVDESASLQNTDPEAVRVAAIQRALDGLLSLTTSAGDASPQVEVLPSVFSFDFQAIGEWTPLDETSAADLRSQADALRDRNKGMDTDFTNALAGAREALAERAVAIGTDDGAEVCKSILLFTDGRYDLGVRENASQLERFGDSKPYAPGLILDNADSVAEAKELGLAALCDDGGVADQVRNDEITLLTVALAAQLRPEDEELLAAVTRGQAGERSCGGRDGTGLGAYVAASDSAALIATFDVVATRLAGGTPVGPPSPAVTCEAECENAGREFTVDASLRRVHLFVTVPEGAQLQLRGPGSDDPLDIATGEASKQEFGGAEVSAAWPSETTATIEVVPAAAEARGAWALVLRGAPGGEGTVQLSVFSDVLARLEGEPLVQVGVPTTLTAAVVTRDDADARDLVERAEVVAVLTDPIRGSSTEVPLEADGAKFTGTYTAPETLSSSVLKAVVRMEAVTQDGVELSSSSEELRLVTRRPAGYAIVAPAELTLASVTSDDVSTGDMFVIADTEQASCIWVDQPEVQSRPQRVTNVKATFTGLATSEAGCTQVAANERAEVAIEMDPGAKASGTVSGYLRIWSSFEGGEPLPVDVPFTFEMTQGVDQAKRLLLAVALLAGGLLVPVLLLLVMNLFTTRFQAMDRVRGTVVPVVIRRNGQVMRTFTDGPRGDFRLFPEDFESLAGAGGARKFTFAGLQFHARTSLNPFAEAHAVAAPEEGTADVAREGRRVALALSLAGSWVFLYDPDATDDASVAILGGVPAAEPPEIHGRVVAFIAEGASEAQLQRLHVSIKADLVPSARRMNELARQGNAYANTASAPSTSDTADDSDPGAPPTPDA